MVTRMLRTATGAGQTGPSEFFAPPPLQEGPHFAQPAYLFVEPTSCQQATKTAQGTIYFYWEALGSRGQRVDDKRSEETMMEDLEKTKPVDAAPADDDETGAGCDVCMPPIALVGADDYDYKYLCMPSMVRALRRNQLQRATRHRRDGLDGVGLTGLFSHSRGARAASSRRSSSPRTRSCP